MTKEELKNKQQEYYKIYGQELIRWNGQFIYKWELELLKDINAIDEERISVQPMLRVISSSKSEGETIKTEYLNGNIDLIKRTVEEINSKNKNNKAELIFLPHIYSEYLELDSEIKTENAEIEFAKRQNAKRLIEMTI